MKAGIKAFFGGGSTYFYLAIAIVITSLYGYVNFLEARLDKVKLERDAAISQSLKNGSIVNSQNRQSAQEQKSQQEAKDGKDEIANAVDPINYSFEWVRKRREDARNADE